MAASASILEHGGVLYSGWPLPRLWRRALAQALTIAITGVLVGGCSFSYQLGSLFGKEDEKAEVTHTATPQPDRPLLNARFSEADLLVASQAAAAILARGEKDSSAPWQNPATGARGMVTPIASTYTQDGFTCRDFLASYVREEEESWLQGEACRVHHGRWVVRSLKPWKKA